MHKMQVILQFCPISTIFKHHVVPFGVHRTTNTKCFICKQSPLLQQNKYAFTLKSKDDVKIPPKNARDYCAKALFIFRSTFRKTLVCSQQNGQLL